MGGAFKVNDEPEAPPPADTAPAPAPDTPKDPVSLLLAAPAEAPPAPESKAAPN
jgi:hypothetical protein